MVCVDAHEARISRAGVGFIVLGLWWEWRTWADVCEVLKW